MRVLVTAISGDIGHGVGKILRNAGITSVLVGCDVHNEHPGELFFDKCEIVARADSETYLDGLLQIARRHKVDLIVPTSEPEMRFFLERKIFSAIDGIPLVLPNDAALTIGFDKLATADFLKKHGMPYPWSQPVSDGLPRNFPCIVKERFGAGSKNVVLVEEDFAEFYLRSRPKDIWQEYLQPANEEYTCGLYRTLNGETRTITFKRKLSGGITVYGKVVRDKPEIDALLVRLAEAMDLHGSINAQLMLTSRGPFIFEINPRFSSTVVFRHLLGFQDVIWSVNERLGDPIPAYFAPANGVAFYRGTNEIIIPSVDGGVANQS